MRKAAIVFVAVLFIFSLGLTLRASSQGEVTITRFMKNNKTLYLEIKTPLDMKDLVLEILNEKAEVTHFFVLDNPIVKSSEDNEKNNFFYITRNMAQFRGFDEINLYHGYNRERVYKMKELEIIALEQDTFVKAFNSEENRLKVMTYNIHHGKSLYGTNSIDTIAQLVSESNVDIVGFQEIESGMLRSGFLNQVEYLSTQLNMNQAFGPNLNILGGKYGNAIMSKYPIIAYENYGLPSGREQRGFLRATIDVNGHEIQFIVTHLGLNEEERNRQVSVIQRYMETLQGDVILVGDFNAAQDSTEIRRLSKKLQDVGEITGNSDQPTFDLPLLSKRIDYIFIGQGITIESYEVIKSRASDHYPVQAELVLP